MHIRKMTLLLTGFFALLTAGLHLGALSYYWYWTYWWFDIPIHFFGGIAVSFLAVYVYMLIYREKERYSSQTLGLLSIGGALGIGLLWEAFEFLIGGSDFADSGFTSDTYSDIFTDFSGGLLVYLIFRRILQANKKDSYVKS